MSSKSSWLAEEIREYVERLVRTRESEVAARLREVTSRLDEARMQISIDQGRLMGVLVRMLGATRAIEVGVFTGYSALAVAQHLPRGGTLVACDVSEEWTSMGRPYWREAGIDDRIDLRLGPASETLATLIESGERASFDFAFIDADKTAYDGYYEQCLTLLRPGGVVALDNAFMGGKVLAPKADEEGARVVRELTEKIFADSRVEPSIVPIGDGLLLACKR